MNKRKERTTVEAGSIEGLWLILFLLMPYMCTVNSVAVLRQ